MKLFDTAVKCLPGPVKRQTGSIDGQQQDPAGSLEPRDRHLLRADGLLEALSLHLRRCERPMMFGIGYQVKRAKRQANGLHAVSDRTPGHDRSYATST